MNFRNLFISAIRALKKNKMRSALTSIGIIIGISSVIVMIGLGSSAQVAVHDKMFHFGTNAMSVYRSEQQLVERDLEYLRRYVHQIKYLTPIMYRSAILVKYTNKAMHSRVFGVDNDFFKIKDWKLQYGRFFTELEIIAREKVVVIGNSVRIELFGNVNPLGSILLIQNVPCKVIGSLTEKGQAFSGRDFDNLLVMPYVTAGSKIFNQFTFNEIYVSTHSETMIDETVKSLREYFRRVHNIPDGKMDDFRIKTSKEQLKVAGDISRILTILLAGIASISLLVGGVGIMNIMLVSVSERTREIGIRMAIGAKKKDILVQFLIEAVTLSSIGGLAGITLGLSAYFIIATFLDWPFLFSPLSIFISFSFSGTVGIFFGYYPARKASSLKPIEALRYE